MPEITGNIARHREYVCKAMADAWSELVPFVPFDEAAHWRECGVDSLTGIQLLAAMEQSSGLLLDYSALMEDRTLGELIDCLAADPGYIPDTDLLASATIALIVQSEGFLHLQPFIRAAQAVASVQLLSLPTVDEPLGKLTSIPAWTASLLPRIQDSSGTLIVAGYSFGGCQALDLAEALGAAGQNVGLLLLLDPPIAEHPIPVQRDTVRKAPLRWLRERLFDTHHMGGIRAVLDSCFYWFVRRLAPLRLEHQLLLKGVGDARRRVQRCRDFLMRTQGVALRTWKPSEYSRSPALLVRTDEMGDHGLRLWHQILSDLSVEYVGGTHRQIFEPARLALIFSALESAIPSLRDRENA